MFNCLNFFFIFRNICIYKLKKSKYLKEVKTKKFDFFF